MKNMMMMKKKRRGGLFRVEKRHAPSRHSIRLCRNVLLRECVVNLVIVKNEDDEKPKRKKNEVYKVHRDYFSWFSS